MASCKESLEENICPICMYVLIQPVTMPCSHELCLPCFKQNVEEANFCCPMCRMRISTWARKAARNKALVNQERWQEIQRLFPDHINKRLNGEDEDDTSVIPVNIRLARPGEIKTEYEEQLRKLRQEYAEQRRKEQEASEQLIRKLQEQEKKKMAELESLEKQDEELAKELSDIMNKADLFSPYSTRSGSGTSESGSIKSCIESMKSKDQASGSPYPYPCFTPTANGKICVDKDRALLLEQKFKQNLEKERHLLTTQDLLKLEKEYKLTGKRCNSKASATAVADTLDSESRTDSIHSISSVGQNSTLSQDEILQHMSEQLDLGNHIVESPDCVIIEAKSTPGSTEKKNLKLNLKTSRNTSAQSNKSGPEVIELDTPTISGIVNDSKKRKTNRSSSAQSNDSISPELAHFRPIRACPLTPPRQLSGGRVVEPVLIRTTPRNLSKSFSTEERSLSDIDASSPIMQKCLEQLQGERKDKVVKMSKSTTTGAEFQDNENKNPDPSSGENTKKHITNNLINNRSTEFKDISNSPLPKRKYESVEDEPDITSKHRKLIIPLEPDLNDNDEVFESNPFNIKLATVSPLKRDCSKESSSSRSRSDSRSKGKVKHKKLNHSQSTSSERNKTKDNFQSAITKWTKKQDEIHSPHLNQNDNNNLSSKHNQDYKSRDKTKSPHNAKKDKHNTIDSYFERSTEKKPKLRSREKLRQPRHPEYDYTELTPKKRKVEKDIATNGAVSKLSFNSEGSDSETSESVSESGKNSYLGNKKKMHRTTYEFDEDFEESLSILSRKKRKTDMDAIMKRRHKSLSDKIGAKKHKTVNSHGNSTCNNRTVEEFFKVTEKPRRRTNLDLTIGEMEGIISGSCLGHYAGVITQEEKDRLFAQELQKQFDLEHKYNLNSVRLKGSDESYSLRHQNKAV